MKKEEIIKRQGSQRVIATHREMLLFFGCRETEPPEVVYHMTDMESAQKIMKEKRIRCFNSYGCYFLPKKEYMPVYLNIFVQQRHQRVTTDREVVDLEAPVELVLLEIRLGRSAKEPHRWYDQEFVTDAAETTPEFTKKLARLQLVHRGDLRFQEAKLVPIGDIMDNCMACYNIFVADVGLISEGQRFAHTIEEYIEKRKTDGKLDEDREAELRRAMALECPVLANFENVYILKRNGPFTLVSYTDDDGEADQTEG